MLCVSDELYRAWTLQAGLASGRSGRDSVTNQEDASPLYFAHIPPVEARQPRVLVVRAASSLLDASPFK